MWYSKNLRRRPSPASLLLAFLLIILAISLGLGYNAFSTARTHRTTVEETLTDYAGMAAWQFSSITRENVDFFLRRVFDDVTRRASGREFSPLDEVYEELHDAVRRYRCECRDLRDPSFYFRVDLRDSSAVTLPSNVVEPSKKAVSDIVIGRFLDNPDEREGLVAVPAGVVRDSSALVAYAVLYDWQMSPMGIYGFVVGQGAFNELFSRWYERATLLPPTVAGDLSKDSLLHLSIQTPDGAIVFSSDDSSPDQYAANDTIGLSMGTLVVEASIKPEAASRLIIGGLPRSRVPLLLGLILVTLGVGTAAVFLIRREHQLARLRDDFVSGVSHELRTPLAQIRMFAELLEGGKLRTDAERQRSLDVVNREARRLAHLVENVLQYSRLRRAPDVMAVEEADAGEIVGDAIDVFRPLAGSLDVNIRTDIEAGTKVLADRDAVKQMLLNLLDNAFKYGPKGQTVTVGAKPRSDGTIWIFVEDEGPGIPNGDRRRVWEPYRRLSHHEGSSVVGTGIGLAVVSQLAALHQGRVWVEDGEQGGARFVMEFHSTSSVGG